MKFSTSVTRFLPLTLTVATAVALINVASKTRSSTISNNLLSIANRLPINNVISSVSSTDASFIMVDDVKQQQQDSSQQHTTVSSVVEPLIEKMRHDFSQLPLVKHLEQQNNNKNSNDNNSKDSKYLMFLPYMTFFVNSFSDINRMILPYQEEDLDDDDEEADLYPYKEAINQHCYEDSNHMYLLWKDLNIYYDTILAKQGSGITNFSSSIKLLWDDALSPTRALGYEISKLVGTTITSNKEIIIRYSMIRVMEEVGNVFFEIAAGYQMKKKNDDNEDGIPSSYLSHDHLELENGHLQQQGQEAHDDDDEDVLTSLFNQLQLDTIKEKQQVEIVMKQTYNLFANMLNSVYNNMISPTIEKM